MSEMNTYAVNDMTCGHCVGTVRNALETALPGSRIEIDLEAHKVSFTGDKTRGEAAIREVGYTPEAV